MWRFSRAGSLREELLEWEFRRSQFSFGGGGGLLRHSVGGSWISSSAEDVPKSGREPKLIRLDVRLFRFLMEKASPPELLDAVDWDHRLRFPTPSFTPVELPG